MGPAGLLPPTCSSLTPSRSPPPLPTQSKHQPQTPNPKPPRTYDLTCNWKVFADNYLDGGYHVPIAHPDLAAQLDLGGYRNELHGVASVQVGGGGWRERERQAGRGECGVAETPQSPTSYTHSTDTPRSQSQKRNGAPRPAPPTPTPTTASAAAAPRVTSSSIPTR